MANTSEARRLECVDLTSRPSSFARGINLYENRPGGAPDSQNVLPALLGESQQGRQLLVEQASGLALRDGNWKFIAPNKSAPFDKNTNTELGNSPQPQLYDLASDIGETRNLAAQHPQKVNQMSETLQKISA